MEEAPRKYLVFHQVFNRGCYSEDVSITMVVVMVVFHDGDNYDDDSGDDL